MDDIEPDSSQEISQTLPSGQWRITEFVEDGVDETSEFTGYLFSFNTNGTIQASKPGISEVVNGTWNTVIDDGKTELWLAFPKNAKCQELHDDWYTIEMTTQRIRLEDDNDNFTDLLTFEK